jgi:FKBP-type peptidyl-prolyl cis-trans isomerase FklB
MKIKTLTLTLLTGLLAAGISPAQSTNVFKSDQEKLSYAIGVNVGSSLKRGNFEVDLEVIKQAMKDALSGEATRLTDQEAIQTITAYQQEKRRQLLEKNKQEAEAFLEANKTKPGVITLPNGLQYKVLAEGSGESPKPEDIVTAHYRGTMIDGTEFDASKPDQPLTRAANQVIKGWTEALTRMKPGAKWQLYIPPDLAYGERGSPPRIAPNSALIFDVELLSFKPAPPPTPPPAPQPLTSDIIKVPSLEEMKKGAKIETIKAEDVERLQKEAQKQGQPK